MPEDARAQKNFVQLNEGILRDNGVVMPRDAVILDYGCGTGRFTYDYHDAGFSNAFGYDIKNYLDLRLADDIRFFRFDEKSEVPWPDNTFDFVFATSVFEHVIDQEKAYREVARVLKPGGYFLNTFPSKWKPIEPHMYVPFGGVIQSRLWFELWAAMGIRNEYQQQLAIQEVADKNHHFSIHGIKYPTGGEINRMLAGIFSESKYVERAFVRQSPGRSRHLAAPMRLFPPLALLFRFAHTRVILSRK
jgi:SAM-dependent methyltransferase